MRPDKLEPMVLLVFRYSRNSMRHGGGHTFNGAEFNPGSCSLVVRLRQSQRLRTFNRKTRELEIGYRPAFSWGYRLADIPRAFPIC